MWLGWAVLGTKMRDLERHIYPAHGHLPIVPVFGFAVEGRADRGEDGSLQPSDGFAFRIETSAKVHGGGRMIKVEPDVFFASPGDLDRLANLFRQNGRLGHIVRLRFASKGAAQKSDMTDHVFGLNADRLGHRLLHVLRAL